MSETFSFEPDGIRLGVVRGISYGLFGPPGMPADIVAKINAEVRKIFADPEIKKNFLERQYFESIAGTPEQLAKYIRTEEPKWRKVIHDAKVKGE